MSLKWIWIVAFAALSGPVLAQDETRLLTVVGEGRVEVAPDMATVTLGVTTEAEGAREAIDGNSRAMAAVLKRLQEAGIAERDLQTANFSVSPQFDYSRNDGPGVITGFVAENSVMVRVRDLAALGGILDAVARDGANSFRGLQFGLQDPVPAEDEARKAAVAEARRKAALYASAAGVTLGEIVTIGEDMGVAPGPMMMQAEMRMAASDQVPVAAGEVTVTARVTLVYAIE